MNINTLFLTKFKCLFNKNYQKRIQKTAITPQLDYPIHSFKHFHSPLLLW